MSDATLISRENNIAHIQVLISAEDVGRHYRSFYKDMAKRFNIPGFRKGKVPSNVLRQKIGKETVDENVGSMLKDFAIQVGLRKLNLIPRAGTPQWHSEPEINEDIELNYEVSLPVLPEVKLPDFSKFEITVPKLNVNDAMKDRYRERLAERFTEWEEAEKVSEIGGGILFHFTSTNAETGDETPFKHNEMRYVIGREGNLPGWDTELTGLKAGEEKTFEYDMPENFADLRVAGKKLNIKVNVDKVFDLNEPEFTEEFVTEKLRMESLEKFNEFVTESLNQETEIQFEQNKQDLVMQKVLAEMETDISDDMINDEIDGLMQENEQTLRRYGSSLDEYLKEKGQDLKEFRESLADTAERKIKLFLAVREVAAQNNIQVTNQDMQNFALRLMREQGLEVEQIQQLLNNRDWVNQAHYQITSEKAVRFMADQVVVDVDEKEYDEAEASAE
ncbi:MAG: trigger factor [Planctomycetales bacterium]|nr:trigger factor [bacterium]UNM07705.1 MAG: trigger factor [Planctomycetales bacterium]